MRSDLPSRKLPCGVSETYYVTHDRISIEDGGVNITFDPTMLRFCPNMYLFLMVWWVLDFLHTTPFMEDLLSTGDNENGSGVRIFPKQQVVTLPQTPKCHSC